MALLVGACEGTGDSAGTGDNAGTGDSAGTEFPPGSQMTAQTDPASVRTGSAADADTSELSGLWDASTDDDTLYLYIDRSGHWYGYDYAADTDGDGNNCHYIFGPYALQPLGEHRFRWHDSLGSRDIELRRDGDSLRYADAEGEWQLAAVAGVSITDLVVCGKVM